MIMFSYTVYTIDKFHIQWCLYPMMDLCRGELSYLVPLGSYISAPYFKQCFFRGGGYYPPDWVKHHASQSQDKFTLMFINERKRNANTYLISNFDSLEAAPSNLLP